MKKTAIAIILSILTALTGCGQTDTDNRQPEVVRYEGTIVAVGDSLTEGLGVAEESAYPALLEERLQAAGYRYRVINAGISGETSSATLARIEWILTLEPDIVILTIGANDGFRGIDPELIKSNIRGIITALKEKKSTVVLAGMKMVQNLGNDYTAAFEKIYPQVAREEDVALIPFFLAGVAANPKLNQADGIHPTAEGYRVIVDHIFPYVTEAIQTHEANP
jgi:acyl-CoA thioesterase-1